MAVTTTLSKPFSSSSSSSSSSNQPPDDYEYDVFLSFRGEDTRKNFTDHLYHALTEAGIRTFRDDEEIRKGENLSFELLPAIRGSRISLIVFSKNYASSRWCLEELVEIMECQRNRGLWVLPLFYDVDPCDVRNQRGSYEQAFVEHEKRYLLDKDKVFRWRGALNHAASISGFHLRSTADGHEAEFIRKIIHCILSVLDNKYLFVARYPVGVEARMEDMTSLLCVGANDVRMVGILGMGGTGKTTIAKAIYNKFYLHFEGRNFLENVRETSNQHGLVRLQKQLLSETLRTSKIKVSSVASGIVMIQQRLRRKRVLVIVDDVDQLDQLNAIAGSRDWFGLGSRIIITTRYEQLLKNLIVDGVYTTKQMSDSESLELFSWHAFRNKYPTEGYMDISRSVVAYSGGLPLALDVLGSFLFGKSMQEWNCALERLKRIPNHQVQKILRISFDALSNDTEKDIFLDISCFFIGMDKNYVVQILNGCGFFPQIGITVLIQRCLLTVDERNKLMMHDLLRDMGREIVRENCPKEHGKRCRLWLHEEVIDILKMHEGRKQVEGLALKLSRSDENFNTIRSQLDFNTETFKKMKRLRLLQLDHAQLTGDYEYLPKELRWLRWHGFPLKFIPNNFCLRKIVAIDLRYSNLKEVWEDPKLLNKLEVLNLSHSHDLTRTPDFSRLPNLEKLVLKDCTSLFEVHQSIGDLDKLVLINLKGCKNLRSLPKSLYKLKSLKTLILCDCSNIDNLADDLGEMECLTTLRIDNTAIRTVPFTIGRLKNLKHLSLGGCKGLQPLPGSLQGLSSLKELCLNDCDLSNDKILKDLGSLCSLQSLDLQRNKFQVLPSSFGGLLKLRRLTLDYCTELQSIADLPKSLNILHATNCMKLERMPNVSEISNMQTLFLTNCHKLVEIPGLYKLLKYFGTLHMEECNNMTSSFKQSILQECTMSGVGNELSIFLPGGDIPDCFMYKDEGPSVCFEVPRIIDLNVVGFVVCTVYSPRPSNDNIVSQNLLSISIVNHTKNISQASRQITADVVISLEDHLWLGNVSKGEFNLEGGDKVDVTIDFGVGFIVKKIGVSLLYDGVLDGKMIPYASTSNEDVKA
ncbi:disease resistance protein RPV1-like [Quercus robur]|uniref:disease resistance protein RPV1-like n=1 Tax=Quercus robur TaxID=38942 RepID=UPI0021632CD8|nr:disease resistance protein RPV1-like [Quercus robur]